MRLIRGYWKTIVIGIAILYVSIMRDSGITLPNMAGADKLLHICMYVVLGGIACWDSWKIDIKGWKLWLISVVIPIVYGGLIELVQEQWFAPRSGEWLDWLADGIGVIIGAISIMIIRRSYDKRNA